MASFRERLGECPWTVSHPPSRQLVRSPEHPVGCEPCTCSALCGGGICEEAVSDLDAQARQQLSGSLSPATSICCEPARTLMPGQSQHEPSSSPQSATLPRSDSSLSFRASNLRTGRLVN